MLNADFGGDPVGAGHWAVCGEAEPPPLAGCHDGPVWRSSLQVQSHLQVLLTHKPAPPQLTWPVRSLLFQYISGRLYQCASRRLYQCISRCLRSAAVTSRHESCSSNSQLALGYCSVRSGMNTLPQQQQTISLRCCCACHSADHCMSQFWD